MLHIVNKSHTQTDALRSCLRLALPGQALLLTEDAVYAATKGFLDAVPVEELQRYETELYRYLETRHAGVLTGIVEKKILDDEVKNALEAALNEFGQHFMAGRAAAVA